MNNFTGIVIIKKGVPAGWIHSGDIYEFKNGQIVDMIKHGDVRHDEDAQIFSFHYKSFDYFRKHCDIDAVFLEKGNYSEQTVLMQEVNYGIS